MKQRWTPTELVETFTLSPDERTLLTANMAGHTKLGFVILLKFLQYEGRFPKDPTEAPPDFVGYLAQQLDLSPDLFQRYDWQAGAIKKHRAKIRAWTGFRPYLETDRATMITWLCETVLPYHQNVHLLLEKVYKHFRHLQIEPPTPGETEKLVRSARRTYEDQFCQTIYEQLSEKTRAALDALLKPDLTIKPDSSRTLLQQLRAISGQTDLEIVLQTARYLEKLKQIDLPATLFQKVSPKLVEQYRQRTAVETPTALERHPDPIKYTLLAAFSHLRRREISDDLVDRLLQIVHKMGTTAEKRVYKELLADLKRVTGKTNLLFMIAEAALDNPAGQVQEVIYPIADEETLETLVKEYRSPGPAYRLKIERTMRRSYSRHYRRMMPVLLNVLVFRTNNKVNQPVLEALDLLRTYPESSPAYYPVDETVPLEGIVPPHLHELVVKTNKKGVERVNRINYELCVWRALRERLRNKSIWVVGANHYRNPDEDLPADFEAQRTQYYEDLNQPLDADTFTDQLQQQMRDALTMLDKAMPTNPSVTILSKQGGWIQMGKLPAQKPAPNLDYLRSDIDRFWPMTSLLDILKESEFRVQFTDFFTSVSRREVLQRDTLQKRLLLCLYGLGTNTGLKRVSNATQATAESEKHEDLRYVFQRYIHKDALREAIGAIVNETLRIRQTHIWGEATTACASDARKFTAWDQNLVTEWHQRYHGRGVMIYWHVERNSACIHSQLKSCSSSEVAAMIEGVMRHCTEMEVEKNYVDTHGQSEIGFAFCHLLGFQLLPRLKGIHRKRLYRPDKGQPEAYPNLQPILTRPINWQLIRDHYDDMIQYATALRLGTAEADTILKRFSRNKPQHPTYRALTELGKVVRTIFLCNYLASEDLRREIHEALNVIESWNSANDFIFFGKGNEFATNRPAVQELSALSLHLLQASLVYINTLMIQRVLAQPDRLAQMTPEDWRALTPLIYHHINPYGVFSLDMTQRLAL